jgi:hypothetical protein
VGAPGLEPGVSDFWDRPVYLLRQAPVAGRGLEPLLDRLSTDCLCLCLGYPAVSYPESDLNRHCLVSETSVSYLLDYPGVGATGIAPVLLRA